MGAHRCGPVAFAFIGGDAAFSDGARKTAACVEKTRWGQDHVAHSMCPDLAALVDQNVEEELKAVEDTLREKVTNELNIGETQSIEDAVKDKVEQEIGNALRGLLGGN